MARRFAETMAPVEALRAWMLLFVDYIAGKEIIAPALNSVAGGRRSCTRDTETDPGSDRCAGEAGD